MFAINAYTQNLGVDPFETLQFDLVRRDLARSDRRPGQWEKDQSNIFGPHVIAQAHQFILVAFQNEIGSHLTNS